MLITETDGWLLPEVYPEATRMAKPLSFGAPGTDGEKLVDGAAR